MTCPAEPRWSGVDRVNQILTSAAAEVREEFPAIQPHVDHTRTTPEPDGAEPRRADGPSPPGWA
ncbi:MULTISPECIES: hypothetical protein [Streptomyces]|uniref:hypothetical protein n=1 Tax=Streptomyces TaxID=1883 RepID=UPI00142E0A40|nr:MULTISPECIES: hypothetical protein [Streptomyces]